MEPANWITTLGSIGAAIAAGVFAWRSRVAQHRAELALSREQRLSSKRDDVYKPLVESFQRVLDSTRSGIDPSTDALVRDFSEFATWAQVYGSDEVTLAFKHFNAATASEEPPAVVALYYFGQMLVAIRRDLGDPSTRLNGGDLLSLRINDYYGSDMARVLEMSESDFLREIEWTPPWLVR